MQHGRGRVNAALNSANPESGHATRDGDKRQRLAAAEGAAAPTALIIEPQASSRARIRQRLEREGIAVAEAEDGLTGWNAVRRRQPDLILSSLHSRGLGGIDLLKRVRATSDLPIILYTATPDVAAAVEATKLGAQDVLLVPSDLEKLIERARALVTQNAARTLTGLEEQIIGKSPHMQRVRERVLALSSLRVPVLV
jgi:DNA-binding NtrC family response regulator